VFQYVPLMKETRRIGDPRIQTVGRKPTGFATLGASIKVDIVVSPSVTQ